MIRTLIAEGIVPLRALVVALLSAEPDIRIVGELERGEQIVPVARELRPDIAIVDIDLPGMDGLTAAGKLNNAIPECRVLILASGDHPGALGHGLAAHALGFLDRNEPAGRLVQYVRQVMRGRLVIDPNLAGTVTQVADNPLTDREVDVLRLAAEGAATTEIADGLHLTAATVRNYFSRAISKVDASDRVDAIRIVTEAGWFRPAPPAIEEETESAEPFPAR